MNEMSKLLEENNNNNTSISIDTCIFCLDDADKIIKFNCCNTYYHKACLEKYIEHNKDDDDDILCPSCRQELTIIIYKDNKQLNFYKLLFNNGIGALLGCLLIIFSLFLLKAIR